MKSRLGIRSCLALILLGTALVGLASAQGMHNITLRANANPFPGHDRYANVWGDGNFAYVGSYFSNGVLIFDITNPDSPVLAANYTNAGYDSQLEDVEVQNGVGFFASNNKGGIHIVDVSNPYSPKLITRISSANGGWDTVHTLLVHGNYLYVPHFLVDPYMQVWDISYPASPVLKWQFLTTDPSSIRASSILNNRLYTSGRGGHTDIWDITNIATQSPVLLGTILSGSLSHSSSPTPDGNYLVASRELKADGGDVRIYNVASPGSASLVSLITMPKYGIESVSPHNPAVMGNLLFHSWYDAGIVVFDISDPTTPVMVGNYDTWPGAITIGRYDGDWGIYPYLGQDRILGVDQDTGLYILDARGVNSNGEVFSYVVNPPPASQPVPLTPAPVTLTGGASATLFLMGYAPAGGMTVNLSSTGPATTASTVTIPAGQHTANISVSTSPVGSATQATLTASYNGGTATATLNVVPPVLTSFTIAPTNVAGGGNATGTVKLSAVAGADTPVGLSIVSGATAIASMPSSVTVTAGTSSASFTIATNSVSTSTAVSISATLGSVMKTAGFTVGPNAPTSLTFSPSAVAGGGNSTGQVSFAAAVTVDTQVTLSIVTGATAISSIPASVTVTAGNSSATFQVATATVSSSTAVQISASASGGSTTGTLNVVAPAAPSNLTYAVNPLVGGNGTTATVTVASAVALDTTVTLSVLSGGGAVSSIPPTVVVPAGKTSATFQIVTLPVVNTVNVQVSASTPTGTVFGTLAVVPPGPSSVVFLTNPVQGGKTTQVRVVMQKAPLADTLVTLAVVNGASAVNSIPSSVFCRAGHNTVVFNMVTNTVSTQTTVQVSASANGATATGTETVNAP